MCLCKFDRTLGFSCSLNWEKAIKGIAAQRVCGLFIMARAVIQSPPWKDENIFHSEINCNGFVLCGMTMREMTYLCLSMFVSNIK